MPALRPAAALLAALLLSAVALPARADTLGCTQITSLRDNIVGHFGTHIQNVAGTFVDVHTTLF
jgi:hypothetical protein